MGERQKDMRHAALGYHVVSVPQGDGAGVSMGLNGRPNDMPTMCAVMCLAMRRAGARVACSKPRRDVRRKTRRAVLASGWQDATYPLMDSLV